MYRVKCVGLRHFSFWFFMKVKKKTIDIFILMSHYFNIELRFDWFLSYDSNGCCRCVIFGRKNKNWIIFVDVFFFFWWVRMFFHLIYTVIEYLSFWCCCGWMKISFYFFKFDQVLPLLSLVLVGFCFYRREFFRVRPPVD